MKNWRWSNWAWAKEKKFWQPAIHIFLKSLHNQDLKSNKVKNFEFIKSSDNVF